MENVEQKTLAEQAKEVFICQGAQSVLDALNLLGGLFLEMKNS